MVVKVNPRLHFACSALLSPFWLVLVLVLVPVPALSNSSVTSFRVLIQPELPATRFGTDRLWIRAAYSLLSLCWYWIPLITPPFDLPGTEYQDILIQTQLPRLHSSFKSPPTCHRISAQNFLRPSDLYSHDILPENMRPQLELLHLEWLWPSLSSTKL